MPCVYKHNIYENDFSSSDMNRYTRSRHMNWLSESMARNGAVIVANTANGYLHMTKLAAPTIPPMVRAPFANYLPDYMIIDHRIWYKGFGSVKIAGYWDNYWQYSRHQAYVS